jgi:hypothetical protein
LYLKSARQSGRGQTPGHERTSKWGARQPISGLLDPAGAYLALAEVVLPGQRPLDHPAADGAAFVCRGVFEFGATWPEIHLVIALPNGLAQVGRIEGFIASAVMHPMGRFRSGPDKLIERSRKDTPSQSVGFGTTILRQECLLV